MATSATATIGNITYGVPVFAEYHMPSFSFHTPWALKTQNGALKKALEEGHHVTGIQQLPSGLYCAICGVI